MNLKVFFLTIVIILMVATIGTYWVWEKKREVLVPVVTFEEISVDFVLSSLSAPKGMINVLQNIVTSTGIEKIENQNISFRGGFVDAMAEPLQFIEEITIRNETNEPVLLYEINNEQDSFLTLLSPQPGPRNIPFMFLAEKFFNEKGGAATCKDRNIFTNDSLRTVGVNNICNFTNPIEIQPKSSLILRPELYAVSYGHTGGVVQDVLNGKHKNFVETNIDFLGGQTLLIPEKYAEYDGISGKYRFSVGGFIVTDIYNDLLLSKLLKIKDKNGKAIKIKVGNSTIGKPLVSYKIPSDPFVPKKDVFDENILGMQVFWYMNDFWDAADFTGKYDTKTAEALRQFQRKTRIAETGKFDEATMFVTNAFDRNVHLYENYGDEDVTISFDAPQSYFRVFSVGSNVVYLKNDISFLSKIAKKKNCTQSDYASADCGVRAYTLDNDDLFTLGGITILNNTLEAKRCVLVNPNNIGIKNFNLLPNEMYSQSVILENIMVPTIHRLQCGGKVLEIEMLPKGTPLF